ncbi:hypothetical protein BJ742DRAFT_2841 [Cladochytrium replicatum]|nr:hypothetical protein BJ742DRAFT_2841 [Cladochytrium replicatum]
MTSKISQYDMAVLQVFHNTPARRNDLHLNSIRSQAKKILTSDKGSLNGSWHKHLRRRIDAMKDSGLISQVYPLRFQLTPKGNRTINDLFDLGTPESSPERRRSTSRGRRSSTGVRRSSSSRRVSRGRTSPRTPTHRTSTPDDYDSPMQLRSSARRRSTTRSAAKTLATTPSARSTRSQQSIASNRKRKATQLREDSCDDHSTGEIVDDDYQTPAKRRRTSGASASGDRRESVLIMRRLLDEKDNEIAKLRSQASELQKLKEIVARMKQGEEGEEGGQEEQHPEVGDRPAEMSSQMTMVDGTPSRRSAAQLQSAGQRAGSSVMARIIGVDGEDRDDGDGDGEYRNEFPDFIDIPGCDERLQPAPSDNAQQSHLTSDLLLGQSIKDIRHNISLLQLAIAAAKKIAARAMGRTDSDSMDVEGADFRHDFVFSDALNLRDELVRHCATVESSLHFAKWLSMDEFGVSATFLQELDSVGKAAEVEVVIAKTEVSVMALLVGSQRQRLEERIGELESSLSSTQAAMKAAVAQRVDDENEIEAQVEAITDEAQSRLSELEGKLNAAVRKAAGLEESFNAVRAHNEQLEIEIAGKNAAIAAKEIALDLVDQERVSQDAEKARIAEEKALLEQELNAKLEELQLRADVAHERLKEIQGEIVRRNERIAQLESEIVSLVEHENVRQQLEADLGSTQSKITELESQILQGETTQQELNKFRELYEQVATEKSQLQTKLTEATEATERALESARTERDELLSEKAELEAMLASERTNHTHELDGLRQELIDLQATILSKDSQIEAERSAMEGAEKELAALRERYDADRVASDEAIASLQTDLNESRKFADLSASKATELEGKLRELQAECEASTTKSSELEANAVTLRERIALLEGAFAEVTGRETKLKSEIMKLNAEKDELIAVREKLASGLGQYKDVLDRLQQERNTLAGKWAEMESSMQYFSVLKETQTCELPDLSALQKFSRRPASPQPRSLTRVDSFATTTTASMEMGEDGPSTPESILSQARFVNINAFEL